jgi:hypothetical protein
MVAQFVGDILEEVRDGYAQSLGAFVMVGRRPCSTGELNFLLPHLGFAEIERQFTARTPEIDLKGQRVQPRSAVEHPLQRRIGNEAAVPIIFAVDFGGRETRRQCAAGDDMRRADVMGRGIEIDKIGGFDVYRLTLKRMAPALIRSKSDQASFGESRRGVKKCGAPNNMMPNARV